MEKIFITQSRGEVETYEAAIKQAKREAGTSQEDKFIFKAVAVVKYPDPDLEVVTL